jgi:hypothetical protein
MPLDHFQQPRQFMRPESIIPRQHHRIEPELRRELITVDVHVRPEDTIMPMRILCAAVFAALILPRLSGAQAAPHPAAADAGTIACRALETHTDDNLKATVVVFHQRDDAQRSQLATLLREHSGAMVEVQAGDGAWRRARVVRLKSCFGRGLLFLAAPAPFPDHTEFALRLPTGSESR